MEKKYQLRIFAPGIIAFSDNLDALQKLANSADMDFEGRLGYDIADTATGEVMAYQKTGLECTLQDLADLEIPSVRLYNCVLRHLIQVTGRGMEYALKNITLRDMRDMMFGGKFVQVRNMGAKTYGEFYDLLIEFCGDTRATRLAINENILLNENQLGHKFSLDARVYWADLSAGYFQKFPF